MSKNNNLHSAKKARNDEFYTMLSDVEKEMKYYRDFFKGKKVLCNCNDDQWSAFFKYFSLNFEFLGLKKLTCVSYNEGGHGKKYVFEGDVNGNRKVDQEEITITELKGCGDFSDEEGIAELQDCDVVVTNPPFSLFRDFVALLEKYNKKYIVVGNDNARTYKEIFRLIKENKMWLGINHLGTFRQPDGSIKNFGNISWFTNVEHGKRNEVLELTKTYSNEYYPKYDNYDAIEVSKTVDIPMDYEGVMGVPISFLDKYNPNQFEIVGLLNSSDEKLAGIPMLREYKEFKERKQDGTFTKASGNKTKGNPVLKGRPNKGNYYINIYNGECVYSTYARILIRHKK